LKHPSFQRKSCFSVQVPCSRAQRFFPSIFLVLGTPFFPVHFGLILPLRTATRIRSQPFCQHSLSVFAQRPFRPFRVVFFFLKDSGVLRASFSFNSLSTTCFFCLARHIKVGLPFFLRCILGPPKGEAQRSPPPPLPWIPRLGFPPPPKSGDFPIAVGFHQPPSVFSE